MNEGYRRQKRVVYQNAVWLMLLHSSLYASFSLCKKFIQYYRSFKRQFLVVNFHFFIHTYFQNFQKNLYISINFYSFDLKLSI